MPQNESTAKEVRTWAAENAIGVGRRGRFSAEVIDAFNKAHPRKKYKTPVSNLSAA